MEDKLTINRFLALSAGIPVIDVRSPCEFAGGHIPGAINLPLFSDDERADIGTIFKQQNPDKAFLKGLDYVGPKMAGFVTAARKIAPDGQVRLHCWRGGQRSGSMAWLLRSAGMQVGVLDGGYKAYRNHLQTLFGKKWDLRIVGGETGSGKTAILKHIAAQNQQVLDLEALASHRGSSFGAIGLPGQPSVEQFENEIFHVLSTLDPSKTIWLEDESRSIGRVYIPEAFWNQMLDAPVLRITVPRAIRVQRLVEEYGRFPLPDLEAAVMRIRKRLGDLATRQAIDALHRGDFAETAEIVLKYYDKAYDHTHTVREFKNVYRILTETENPQENAAAVLAFAEKLRHSHTSIMDTNTTNSFRLTQFSHGAGCGCKIAPAVLDSMLKSNIAVTVDPRLLVGNDKKDDAAVYDLGNGKAVISTTDFFMPIVDDAFDFGRIASVNAISDIYAMGGKPLMAIAILGWPVNKIPAEIAAQVLEGSRSVCREAGIMLAGGHSIDNPEPLFGLAVTGEVEIKHLKKNATASPGALLYLTKPLGVGIITTAQKKGIVSAADLDTAIRSMLTLNSLGEQLGKRSDVLALTDVTGFGLLGHLQEMCEGSGYSADIRYSDVPRFGCIDAYIAQQAVPGGTKRNWDSYGHHISGCTEAMKNVLCDPQTSGGLLIAVAQESQAEFEAWLESEGHFLRPFGEITKGTPGKISVQD